MALHLTAPHPKIKLNTTFIENCMLNYFTSTIFTYQLVCLRLFLSIANLSSSSWITSSSNHCQLKWLVFLERFLRHESTPEGLVLPLLMIWQETRSREISLSLLLLPPPPLSPLSFFSPPPSIQLTKNESILFVKGKKKKHMRTSGKGASREQNLENPIQWKGPAVHVRIYLGTSVFPHTWDMVSVDTAVWVQGMMHCYHWRQVKGEYHHEENKVSSAYPSQKASEEVSIHTNTCRTAKASKWQTAEHRAKK